MIQEQYNQFEAKMSGVDKWRLQRIAHIKISNTLLNQELIRNEVGKENNVTLAQHILSNIWNKVIM